MWVTIIIILVLLFVGFEVIKLEHHAKRLKVVLLIIVAILLYLSIIGMMRSEKVDLSSPSGLMNTAYVYFGWVGQTAVNLWDVGVETVHMVGNAIRNKDDDGKRR